MKDNKLLKLPKIVARNEPHEIIDYYFEILQENLLKYDLEEEPQLDQALILLQSSYHWWCAAWED